MSTRSRIEWTEHTWNPMVGCTKVSPGCKYCYAETLSKRLQAMGTRGYERGFQLNFLPERLEDPIKRQTPTIYFVNSMSDLFHEDASFEFLDLVFDTIRKTPWHVYQILTKRAHRMADYFLDRTVPTNAWIGVSVEDQQHGKPRIDILRKIKATTRFLSVEPLLEDLGALDLAEIHWVIVGGESGASARPMDPSWVTRIRAQCEAQKIPFFFKQWGAHGADGRKRSKKANGRLLEGRTWDEKPLTPHKNIA